VLIYKRFINFKIFNLSEICPKQIWSKFHSMCHITHKECNNNESHPLVMSCPYNYISTLILDSSIKQLCYWSMHLLYYNFVDIVDMCIITAYTEITTAYTMPTPALSSDSFKRTRWVILCTILACVSAFYDVYMRTKLRTHFSESTPIFK
jgi:hypothetical protein